MQTLDIPSEILYPRKSLWSPRAGDGCVLWFPGRDDAYSSTIRDKSGNSNHGTINGSTWTRLSGGLLGLNLDGNDDYIEISHNEVLNPTVAMTIEFWLILLAVGPVNGGYIYSKGYFNAIGDNGEYALYIGSGVTDGQFLFRANSLTDTGLSALTLNIPYHLAFTFEGSVACKGYQNGILDQTNTTAIPSSLLNTTNPLNLGRLQRAPTLTYQNYQLFLFRIYNRVLSAPEIRMDFQAERAFFGV